MTFDNPFYKYLQEMADCAQDAGMHPDKINTVCDDLRLSLEDRKAPAAPTLAEQEELSRVEATCDYYDHWKEPEWTLRDEVGESYKEIP